MRVSGFIVVVALLTSPAYATTDGHDYFIVRNPLTLKCSVAEGAPLSTPRTRIDDRLSFQSRKDAEDGLRMMRVCSAAHQKSPLPAN